MSQDLREQLRRACGDLTAWLAVEIEEAICGFPLGEDEGPSPDACKAAEAAADVFYALLGEPRAWEVRYSMDTVVWHSKVYRSLSAARDAEAAYVRDMCSPSVVPLYALTGETEGER